MDTHELPTRYQIRALLGVGGSGRVYSVFDSIRDRELALKLVTLREASWLRREFDTLRQIRHENLTQVLDWDSLSSGAAYYTMELIGGGDWGSLLGKPQPPDEVRRILTGLLRGLGHLHCHGEIHGDLKAGNILLGAGGVVKITDAGMGGSEGAAARQSGTPGYAAPEVWEGAKANARSDLYSVGAMAYEALTGHHPFAGRTVRAVVSGQLEGWVPSPGAHGVRVPPDLERAVMRALERQPALRQGSADEFMEGIGVEDRIGEILGGKLVGREREIAEIEALLTCTEHGRATLLVIEGEPGVGRAHLLEEISNRVVASGGRALRGASASELARASLGHEVPLSRDMTITELAEALWRSASEKPLFLWEDDDHEASDAGAFHVQIARYWWARSIEKGRSNPVLLAVPRRKGAGSGEEMERRLTLLPFGKALLLEQISGLLGHVNLEEELLSRLVELTGGNPELVRGGIADLIDRRLIDRRDCVWAFREVEQIRTLTLSHGATPWSVAWTHLDSDQQRILVVMALIHGKILRGHLASVGLSERELMVAESRGWVRDTGESWAIASESIRQTVLSLAPVHLQLAVARGLLVSRSILRRDQWVHLALRYDPSPDVLAEGIEQARRMSDGGDHRGAADLLRVCFAVASNLHDIERGRTIAIARTRSLLELGEADQAEAALNEVSHWSNQPAEQPLLASRAHMLGKIYRHRGELEAARRQFQRAISLASNGESRASALWSKVELAELKWRHGDEKQKTEAIEELRELDNVSSDSLGTPDERAAIGYQLGAALFAAGQAREARSTLLRAADLPLSSYWRMRIATALGSTIDQLGDGQSALCWMDEAWQCAEKGGFDGFKARILSNRGAINYRLGRFRDALDQDSLAAMWARRLGNRFEYAAGCAGASISLTALARFEEALNQAADARRAAQSLGDTRYHAKGSELAGLALFHMGDYVAAEAAAAEGMTLLKLHANDEVQPRLDWLMGRVKAACGDMDAALDFLERAKTVLQRTRDPEDLPGVEIELRRVRSRRNPDECSQDLHLINAERERAIIPIVQIWGAVAIAEAVTDAREGDERWREVLVSSLALAEDAGVADASWQLCYALGVIAGQSGDKRTERSRYTQAIRILREIAGWLSPEHKVTYLAAPHIRSALSRMDAGS